MSPLIRPSDSHLIRTSDSCLVGTSERDIFGSFLDLLNSEVETFNSFLLGRSLNVRRNFGKSDMFDNCDKRLVFSK